MLVATACVGPPPPPPLHEDTTAAATEAATTGPFGGSAAEPSTTSTAATSTSVDADTTSVSGGATSTSDGSITASVETGDTAMPLELERCQDDDLMIPDDSPLGVTSSIGFIEDGAIVDLRVAVLVTHSWVGDLSFELSHDGTTLVVLDRPGDAMCSGDDVDVVLHDGAVDTIDAACLGDGQGVPALSGELLPESAIAPVFAGQSMTGTWELRVSDGNMADVGTVTGWCLQLVYR